MKKKNLAMVGFMAAPLLAIGIISASARSATDDDAAATYKTKCVACHGQKAEKKYDATIADATQVETILKGKKAEKPPNMPAYAEKGISEDQARALVAYMKTLKQ